MRYRFQGGSGVNFLLVLPLTAPEIVLGASLLTLFLEPHLVLFNINFKLGFTTIVLAHIMFCVSYVALTVKARICAASTGRSRTRRWTWARTRRGRSCGSRCR